MKYNHKGLDFITQELRTSIIIEKSRKRKQDFSRTRKIGPRQLIEYNLNKKGLSSKTEQYKFLRITGYQDISSPGLLKQREKLNPDVFRYLNDGTLNIFYNECKDEVKLYKGYVVTAIDGSDFELPNTKANRSCVRATVSAMVDVLNGYIIDTQIKPYRSSELEMEKEHLKHAKELIIDTPIIRLKDKNYRSVEDFFYSNKSNEKFVTRLKSSDYKEYIENRQTQDEEIEIKYQYDRVRYYRKRNPELYEELMKHKSIKIRMVKFKLETGEEEILATNLGMEFTYTDIAELYKLRWKIEQTYHTLKES